MNNIFHVIKDPVHGTMQFTSHEDKWIKPFIDSDHFQRLRHIKQLGMGDLIFPGAVHTRFNHSLGCCYIASQIAHKIGLSDEERQLVMIACLLHDIGHGPFSHAFEDIFCEKLIRHEDWTPYFLNDYGSQSFFNAYNRLNPRYALHEDKFRTLAEMIMHQSPVKNVLADIVSSQLDADRLDYLLRDNHFCGVRYGEFDFRWMLHCMTIVTGVEEERLGITHKGIGVVEHYLMARRLMTRNIYHGQKKLALEFFLVQLLAHVANHLAEREDYGAIKHTRLGQFLLAVHEFNQKIRQGSQHIENCKHHFLQKHFATYKTLCDYDVFALIDDLAEREEKDSASKIALRLKRRLMPKIVRINPEQLNFIENELATFKQIHQQDLEPWQLMIIQTPHRSYSDEEDPILVMNEQGKIYPLSHFSLMIQAISDRLEHIAFLCIDQAISADKSVQTFLDHIQKIPLAM